jgi:hypothetical protein
MQVKVSGRPPLPGAELRTLQILTELDDYRVRSFSGLVETDTTWLMLTELLRARLLGRRISVTSLCLASRGPITTALRRIGKLQRAGLLTLYAGAYAYASANFGSAASGTGTAEMASNVLNVAKMDFIVPLL